MKLTLESLHAYCTAEGDCLLWNLGTNSAGYPMARLDGPAQNVRRYVFSELMGKELCGKHRVSSKCNNRLCVSPHCLIRLTPGQIISRSYVNRNQDDELEYRRAKMIERYGAVLSLDIARKIRAERMHEPNNNLAREYGCSKKTIYEVKRGTIWRERRVASSVFSWRPA